jgi:predicted Zn-dependent peptidase
MMNGGVRVLAIGFAMALLPAAAPGLATRQSEEWRKRPPEPAAPAPLALPKPRQFSLANGLEVILVEDHRTPLTTMQLAVPIDLTASRNPAILTGEVTLAEATGELLASGAGTRTSRELARDVESLGGRLVSEAADDFVSVAAEVISENSEQVMELMADVLLRPTFPQSEVALYKANRIQKLTADRQDPAFLAHQRFDLEVYGELPYAISAPTPAAVRAITRLSISRYHRKNLGPKGSVLVMAGDFDAARIEAKVRRLFESWNTPATPAAHQPATLRTPPSREVYLIDRPGSEQADFRIGGPAVPRNDRDRPALVVANTILGDGTSSRLFLNIRERLGYAYDVASSVQSLKRAGAFYASSQARTEVAGSAIRATLAEIERMRNEPVSAEDLRIAKNYLSGLFSLSLATQEGITDWLTTVHIFALGKSYLEGYRERIEAVTPGQVQEAAQKYMRTDRAIIVVVGDAKKLRKELESIGRIRGVFDVRGNRRS